MVSTKEKVGGAIGAVLLILALIYYVIYYLLGHPDTGLAIYFCGVAIVVLVIFLVYILIK